MHEDQDRPRRSSETGDAPKCRMPVKAPETVVYGPLGVVDHEWWGTQDPAPILNELAELVAVRPSWREGVIHDIKIELEGAHKYHKYNGLKDGALLAAEKQIRAAFAAVEALRPNQLEHLNRAFFLHRRPPGGGLLGRVVPY